MRLGDIFRTWRVVGTTMLAETSGGFLLNKALLTATATAIYSPNMTLDLGDGNNQVVTVTDGVAFTLLAPLFGGAVMTAVIPPNAGMLWTLTIRNTSGGVAGVATFNAIFKLGAAWVQPATGFSRSIQFRWNGASHVEVGRTAVDVAN